MSDVVYAPGDLVLYRSSGAGMLPLGSDYRPAIVIRHQYFSDESSVLVVRWADTLQECDFWPMNPEEFVRVEVESHE